MTAGPFKSLMFKGVGLPIVPLRVIQEERILNFAPLGFQK